MGGFLLFLSFFFHFRLSLFFSSLWGPLEGWKEGEEGEEEEEEGEEEEEEEEEEESKGVMRAV